MQTTCLEDFLLLAPAPYALSLLCDFAQLVSSFIFLTSLLQCKHEKEKVVEEQRISLQNSSTLSA
jgi:hypothetical protein